MPLYSIPRRSPNPQNVDRVPVNWRRGMFRVWVLASIAWIMGWIIHFLIYGLQGGFQVIGDVLVIPVLLLGPPIALLLFGIAAAWAFRGFKVDDGSTKT